MAKKKKKSRQSKRSNRPNRLPMSSAKSVNIPDGEYETFTEEDEAEFEEAAKNYKDDGDISKPNPHLKKIILEVVDNQLRDNDPPVTRETFERLQALGYTAKQAKEKIAAVVIGDIFEVMTEKKPHDTVAYERKLRALK